MLQVVFWQVSLDCQFLPCSKCMYGGFAPQKSSLMRLHWSNSLLPLGFVTMVSSHRSALQPFLIAHIPDVICDPDYPQCIKWWRALARTRMAQMPIWIMYFLFQIVSSRVAVQVILHPLQRLYDKVKKEKKGQTKKEDLIFPVYAVTGSVQENT